MTETTPNNLPLKKMHPPGPDWTTGRDKPEVTD